MAKSVAIGNGDQAGRDSTAPAVLSVAHAHDAQLRRAGSLLGIAGPPVQVRNPPTWDLPVSDADGRIGAAGRSGPATTQLAPPESESCGSSGTRARHLG